jgi:23S rRNA maturation mini-RNase III
VTDLRALAGRIGRGAALRTYRVNAGFYIYQVASGIGATVGAIHQAEDGEEDSDQTISASIRWIGSQLQAKDRKENGIYSK